ncbi:hypothetical protein SERLA73DRAFT_182273 [Serpula lacrymans var. lacrymans S7.3]|uniref:Uncharacterized protein n=2 Tax=Serpula lacrymans var. lacrymans TaxID=341189 RepID=F8PX00_SERL3|nr:uncharacterized protein SERLADRAFT_468838 [Serpula lacrymans var. lacrymans S7.9]EGN99326.1 hypothetical protein SERLA73DRAFT_182273 [Serpula lacrymans var. lacrymans S7.3]EGO24890.1 hypothetical protein SERLADRAFT_468838 [Serpula lacrymans var. lacrymans S7.9]
MSNLENFVNVTSPEHFRALLSKDLERVSLINFWAPWAAPCTQMNEVVLELAKKYPKLLVLQVEAEEQPDITESMDIEAVPSFIVLRGHALLSRIPGADAIRLTTALAAHLQSPAAPIPTPLEKKETPEELKSRMDGLMSKSKVVLFMKGQPDEPRCGFSRQTVQLLRDNKVEFTHFDILSDESVRQGLKQLNDWPTFPQIIVNGEFVGGLDVTKDLFNTGEFWEIYKSA